MAEDKEGGAPKAQQESSKSCSRASEDLSNGLFASNRTGLASIVRDLQQRRKLANKGTVGPGVTNCVPENRGLEMEKDMELGDATGLYVVGGASTVADIRVGVADKETVMPQPLHTPAKAITTDFDKLREGKDLSVKGASTNAPRKSNVKKYMTGTRETLQEWGGIIRLYPSTLIIPVVVFMLLAGLGIWGVMAGTNAYEEQRKDETRSRAVDAATGFQIQLEQSFTPGVTFQLLVKQRPDWNYWVQNFNATAQELLSRVPNGSIWNLQLQPFAQVMMIYPFRPEDRSQVEPPRDLLGDPTRRDGILQAIKTKSRMVNGPFSLVQGFTGAFVRYPIYVPDVNADTTFDFKYPQNTSALNFTQLPASVQNCTVCYNATTREKWWGMLTVLINYDKVTQGTDAYLAGLRKMGYHYALVRPISATQEQVIAQVGPSSLQTKDAVSVNVKVVDSTWTLRVAPADGFAPTWTGPLIAAVVIIALIMAGLLFMSMVSFRRQRLLLQETMAANHNLAETTRRLEEEKERMDVLLVRQYDLLQCLDANRTKKSDDEKSEDYGSTVAGSRKAMMARIEDARRSLNVAKASVEDPIQMFEVLGAGAFGKVQRAMWRGTVVAVKTMILPANMTGQQKREKMAVMEAAISSSLVHPNIVTTYTYFIRPYHEPVHEGVQQMVIGTSQQHSDSFTKVTAGDQTMSEKSNSSEGAIHSYEVRLVLEFCDKGSLKDALDQHAFMQGGSFNLAAMLETAADVAKAMVHMHAANVLHSDLKARNIMLKSSGMEGRGVVAKVADFGLSTRMEGQETHLSSCFQGTLTHMAPEVMLEGRISKAADVYSFGILMWELFCGGDPFAGVPRAHMGHAITKEARRPKFPPFAPRDYVALASRCWDPDMALRPTFEEVLVELGRMREELAGDTPPLVITPPRPSSPPQTGDGTARGAPGALRIAQEGSGSGAGMLHGNSMNTGGASNGGSVNGGIYNGMVARDNPLALYHAGIVVGGSSMGDSSASTRAAHSSLAQRAIMKSSLAQRHLRKMGIRIGGGSGSGLAPTLSNVEETEEAEAKNSKVQEAEGKETAQEETAQRKVEAR